MRLRRDWLFGAEESQVQVLDLLVGLQEHELVVLAAPLLLLPVITLVVGGHLSCLLVHSFCHAKSLEEERRWLLHIEGGLVKDQEL